MSVNGRPAHHPGMIVDIQTRRLRAMGQLRAFVEGNEAVDFQPRDRDEAYGFVRDTLERFAYRGLDKGDKGWAAVPSCRYTAADIWRLTAIDEAYEEMSGLATREVLRRQFEVFGDADYARLAAPARVSPGRPAQSSPYGAPDPPPVLECLLVRIEALDAIGGTSAVAGQRHDTSPFSLCSTLPLSSVADGAGSAFDGS